MNRLFAKDDEALSAWSEGHYRRLKKTDTASTSDSRSHSHSHSHTTSDQGSGGSPDISWPLERPTDEGNGDAFSPRVQAELRKRSLDISDNLASDQTSLVSTLTVPMKDMLPGQRRDQAGIALRALCLGQILGLSTFFALYHVSISSPLWRPPFFLACLALFHFLEFWTHARFNLPNAAVSAFLLFDNGWPYMAAHTTALVETTVTSLYFPQWQARFSPLVLTKPLVLWLGLALTVVGQLVRSMAIAKAGTNFNHQIQHKKKDTHELVTDGIYGILRHPSYFGFFWWAVGTQVVLGNVFCFWIYVVVLWRFFGRRIANEERHLTVFFGKRYVFYKSYTKIGIPFIWSRDYPELIKPTWEEVMESNKGRKTE